MDQVEQYDTLTEAIKGLQEQGYNEDFNLKEDRLECQLGAIHLYPDDFQIDKVFRFFGPSDVDDESILYAISSQKFGLKGLLVNSFDANPETLDQEMVEKLN